MSENQLPSYELKEKTLFFTGEWSTLFLASTLLQPAQFSFASSQTLVLNFSKMQRLDTNGAYLILQFIQVLKQQKITCDLVQLNDEQQHLMQLVTHVSAEAAQIPEEPQYWLSSIGKTAIEVKKQTLLFVSFLGEVTVNTWVWIKNPSRIRWTAIFHGIDSTGYQAMGIVALLSFLIGVVLCYQMGVQLQTYGASIYVVDLLGISILREFGPLITAIIVAGRTGSAFAAQIGTMKLNQEIDALNTMGLSSTELLILPKIAALTVALPLLSVLSMIAGVFGGMVMAKLLFSIAYADFISRFGSVIAVKMIILGIIKTPIFAILIATVGCFQGLQVSQSAESVGQRTTVSVVQAIFMIIVADAFFSILYSKLGL
ncbi:MAG: ABC transporter permease [Legionellales bacterium]|nr:ABC transporter permease [Legionellales bacterium]